MDINERWEKMWVYLRDNPFQIGFFRSDQDKLERMKRGDVGVLFLENLQSIEEKETVSSSNSTNPAVISL